jgi:hypothetical protein
VAPRARENIPSLKARRYSSIALTIGLSFPDPPQIQMGKTGAFVAFRLVAFSPGIASSKHFSIVGPDIVMDSNSGSTDATAFSIAHHTAPEAVGPAQEGVSPAVGWISMDFTGPPLPRVAALGCVSGMNLKDRVVFLYSVCS